MPKDEYEVISHSRLADCTMFAVDLSYRPPHLHLEIELCYVLAGSGIVSSERGTINISPGDILLFDSGMAHEIWGGPEGVRLIAIQISRNFCRRFCPQLRNIRFQDCRINEYFSDSELCSLKDSILHALWAFFDTDLSGTFRCMSCINEIFAKLFDYVPYQILKSDQMQSEMKSSKRVRRLLLFLEEHFREPLRLRDLAGLEGLSETHISHFFKDQLHITFQDYLSRLRMEAAMVLLQSTDMTVTNIAYECGFSAPKYMNQSFKKVLGMTPAQWRGQMTSSIPLQRDYGKLTMQKILPIQECRKLLIQLGL